MEGRFAALVRAFLQGATHSTSQPYITFSLQAQNELIDAIAGLLQEAYAIGQQHGQAMLPQERAISFSGTRDFLARAAEIVSGIIEHVQDAISNAFGKAQAGNGQSLSQTDIVDTTMNNLIDQMPELVAGDEVTTAVEGAVFDTLQDAGIPEIRSVSEGDNRVCQRCLDNEEAGPIPLGSTFPSGDACPPFHNRCRCNLTTA